jgi:multidrug resistance efflux pump
MGEQKYSIEDANRRLDSALDRLERLAHRARTKVIDASKVEHQVQNLATDRSRLASELDQTRAYARTVEESAKDVSARIMRAMEKVQVALNGEDEA